MACSQNLRTQESIQKLRPSARKGARKKKVKGCGHGEEIACEYW